MQPLVNRAAAIFLGLILYYEPERSGVGGSRRTQKKQGASSLLFPFHYQTLFGQRLAESREGLRWHLNRTVLYGRLDPFHPCLNPVEALV